MNRYYIAYWSRPRNVVFGFIVLTSLIVSGKLTLGLLQQILNVFGQVRESFQYLANAWPTIVELPSIYKRPRAFEAVIGRRPGDEHPCLSRGVGPRLRIGRPA